ncbi:hypothetical protein [Thalassovita sp.]|nr:hypothetical protein [Thalassovita sp.]
MPDRKSSDPLPHIVLDRALLEVFDDNGLATKVNIWWHSTLRPSGSPAA